LRIRTSDAVTSARGRRQTKKKQTADAIAGQLRVGRSVAHQPFGAMRSSGGRTGTAALPTVRITSHALVRGVEGVSGGGDGEGVHFVAEEDGNTL